MRGMMLAKLNIFLQIHLLVFIVVKLGTTMYVSLDFLERWQNFLYASGAVNSQKLD